MNAAAQAQAAREFAAKWKGRGYEKGESQKFWMELLHSVYGVENPADLLVFEQQVQLDHTSFIDVMIPTPHVMIEQKSLGKKLTDPIRQSDGTLLKPIEQARRYAAALPYSARPALDRQLQLRTVPRLRHGDAECRAAGNPPRRPRARGISPELPH